MRVLIDARAVRAKLDGVGRHALSLLLGLSYIESDLEFLVLYASPLPLKVVERSGGPFRNRFQWIKSSDGLFKKRGGFLERLELSWLFKIHNVDMFHDLNASGLWSGKTPVVTTVHELEAVYLQDQEKIQKLRKNFKHSRMVVAVSESVASEIESNFHISRPKIRVIFNAVDPWYSERVSKEEVLAMRERFRLQRPYFLCVTADRPTKNSEFAIKFAEKTTRAKPQSESWVFTLEGKNQRSGNVLQLGLVEDVWLRPLYADAMAVVVPSSYEGFSLPPIEALALGAIPVVSDIAAHRESLGEILPRELFFDPAQEDSLQRALEKVKEGGEPLKTAILQKFRVVCDRYSFKETAAKVHAVYREVIS